MARVKQRSRKHQKVVYFRPQDIMDLSRIAKEQGLTFHEAIADAIKYYRSLYYGKTMH